MNLMTNITFDKIRPTVEFGTLNVGDKFIFNSYDSSDVWMITNDSGNMVSLQGGTIHSANSYKKLLIIPVDVDIVVKLPQ